MSAMFLRCFAFNQPLEKWNVAALKNMDNMFLVARCFKQNLNTWHVNPQCLVKKPAEKKAQKENNIQQKEQNGRFPIFYALQSYFQNEKLEMIQQQLGYKNADKCSAALKKFATCKELTAWLHKGHFDFTHTTLSILEKCKAILAQGLIENATLPAFEAEIKKANVEIQRWRDFRRSYIRVQTDFRRQNQPIFALGLSSGMLYIDLPIKDEWLTEEVEAVLPKIPEIVRRHYQSHEGRLSYPFTSNIVGYSLYLKKGKQTTPYYFDTEGNPTESESPKDTHPRASLSV